MNVSMYLVRFRIGFVAVCVAVLMACTATLNRNEIVGRYVCVYPFGAELLEFRADGTYLQAVMLDGVPVPHANSGRWTYDSGVVRLQAALIVVDGFGRRSVEALKPQEGTWNIPVGRSILGKLILQPNPDQDFAFQKLHY